MLTERYHYVEYHLYPGYRYWGESFLTYMFLLLLSMNWIFRNAQVFTTSIERTS